MFLESIKQRIDAYNDLQNKYNNTELCSEEMKQSMNSIIVIIALLVIIYIVLFILSMYYILKCSIKNRWPILYPILLISLSLIPYYGGIITIGIIIYGMVNCGSVCEAPSEIFRLR
jgi:hypothetical protein